MKQLILLSLCISSSLLANAQNIGIGTTAPTDQLHTTGTVRLEKYKGNTTRLLQIDTAGRLFVPGTVTTDNVGFNITDNGCVSGAVHQKSITVSGLPTSVSSSKIAVRINITHPYVADLQLFLISPGGTQILHLANSDGGAGDDLINTVFTDESSLSFSAVTAADAPFTGKYKPHGSLGSMCFTNANIATLSAFGTGGIINPNGIWTLRIADDAATDLGTFNSWSISFTGTDAFTSEEQNNYLSKFSNGNLAASTIYQQPVTNRIGIAMSNPFYDLDINGSLHNTGTANVGGNAFFNSNMYTNGQAYFSSNAHFDDSIVIGVATPKAKLDINNGRLRFTGKLADGNAHGIEFTNNAGTALNGFYGVYNDSLTGFYGFMGASWSLLFNNINGNLGLQGNANPRVPLSFANAVGNKVSLYDNGDGTHYGIGLQAAQLQFFVPSSSQDIVFGTGNSNSLVEKMRIKGNGNLTVTGSATASSFSTNTGSVLGNGLFVNGDGNITGQLTVGGTAKITGGAPATGKVLTATDANGNAVWKAPASAPQSTAFFTSTQNYTSQSGIDDVIGFVDNLSSGLIAPCFDAGNAFNNTNHAYFAPANGFYHFCYKLAFNGGGSTVINSFSGIIEVSMSVITASGSYTVKFPALFHKSAEPLAYGTQGEIDLPLQAGDFVYLKIYENIGGPLTLSNGDGTRFTGYKLY